MQVKAGYAGYDKIRVILRHIRIRNSQYGSDLKIGYWPKVKAGTIFKPEEY